MLVPHIVRDIMPLLKSYAVRNKLQVLVSSVTFINFKNDNHAKRIFTKVISNDDEDVYRIIKIDNTMSIIYYIDKGTGDNREDYFIDILNKDLTNPKFKLLELLYNNSVNNSADDSANNSANDSANNSENDPNSHKLKLMLRHALLKRSVPRRLFHMTSKLPSKQRLSQVAMHNLQHTHITQPRIF